METLVEVVHILVALFMILVVLVQGGNQGGVGAAFGGGSSSGLFGATGATSLLGKLTYGAAAVFMLTSITLTIMQGKGGDVGLKEKLKATSGQTSSSTTEPAKPSSSTPAASATSGQTSPEANQTSATQTAPQADGPVSASPGQTGSPASSPTSPASEGSAPVTP